MSNTIVESYSGDHDRIAADYQRRAEALGTKGYIPMCQSWAPNRWELKRIVVALLLCFAAGIGIVLLLTMMIDAPGGTMTVIYKK